jgi:cobalamin biosynthesis protein CbiG
VTVDGAPSSGEFPAARHAIGVGLSSDVTDAELEALVRSVLLDADLDRSDITAVATIETRRDHPAVQALGWPIATFAADELAAVPTPNPSDRVANTTGTPSVAEASALLAAGDGAELFVTKRSSAHATVAIARPSAVSEIPPDQPNVQEHP